MYRFYLDGTRLPVTPEKLELKIKNQNKTLTLINEGEVNVLRDAGLTDISFEARLPQQKYPFSSGSADASGYLEKFEAIKTKKKKARFMVTRTGPGGKLAFDTNMTVSLEEYTITEEADEGFDVLVTLKLKQYRDYGVKTVKVKEQKPAQVTTQRPTESAPEAATHKVVAGDCLWNIAQKYLGDGSRYKEVYELNKGVIDKGNRGTGNPTFTIYPNQVFRLPAK